MMHSLRRLLACHWSARRIQRYLDADPSAPLTPGEISRLREHLANCDRCAQVVQEHRALHRALSAWPGRPDADPAAVTRLRAYLHSITEQGGR